MQTAPSGAVMRMESTAMVRISSPSGCHSSLPYLTNHRGGWWSRDRSASSDWLQPAYLMQLSRKTGPSAACTVAFGIQAKAMKIFSLLLRLPHDTAK